MASGTPVVILDNGAYSVKAGISGVDWEPRIFPNSTARSKVEKKVYVSDEIDSCRDLSGLAYRRPFERGMLVNWDAQKAVWDRIFSSAGMDINPTEMSLLVTEPYFNLPNIAETYDQMVFEEWEFASYFRCTHDTGILPECTILVDTGYSYTHVIPMRDGQIIWDHVKRIDVGGKLLTNHLKHLISFRQWNMIDETAIVNAVRESCCYVSMDYKGDLDLCKRHPKSSPIVQEYVLPDFSPSSTSQTGYIRSGPGAEESPPNAAAQGDAPPAKKKRLPNGQGQAAEEEQVLFMGNERFTGPELLFNPSDIGFRQSGLPETIAYVIGQMPIEVQGMYWAHIGIFGGLGMLPNLGERLERDLRALCPAEYEIGIFEAFDTANPPYQGALNLTSSEIYLSTYPVTRAEYLEHGSALCRRRFGGDAYSVNPPGFTSGVQADGEMDDDERERRYAMGLEVKSGRGRKGKGRKEEEEVTSGNWGGRRRRAQGLL